MYALIVAARSNRPCVMVGAAQNVMRKLDAVGGGAESDVRAEDTPSEHTVSSIASAACSRALPVRSLELEAVEWHL
jgi:hypothetical protein